MKPEFKFNWTWGWWPWLGAHKYAEEWSEYNKLPDTIKSAREPEESKWQEWRELVERYGLSDDPEKRTMAEVVKYFAQRATRWEDAYIELRHGGIKQEVVFSESGAKGGKAAIYDKVHSATEKLWLQDRERPRELRIYPTKKELAKTMADKVDAEPETYGLPKSFEADQETIYRELLKRTKGR